MIQHYEKESRSLKRLLSITWIKRTWT